MLGREAKKREQKRATSHQRIQKTQSVDGSGMKHDETRQTAEDNAQDYADANKLDLQDGGTVQGALTSQGVLTVGSSMTAPGHTGITIANGATGSRPHGLGFVPHMVLAQISTDGGTTYRQIMDGTWSEWSIYADATNVYAENFSGSTALVRFRVLG